MSEIGFGPTLTELCKIVQDYVQLKQLKTQFVNDCPGYDWTTSFLKRHKLSLKKGSQIQQGKYNCPGYMLFWCRGNGSSYHFLKGRICNLLG